MTVWQLMNGDQTRDYTDVLLQFGVACIGSGEFGELNEISNPKYKEKGEFSKISPILDIKEGDWIILKSGQRELHAIGIVEKFREKIYNYSNFFDDIDGWDLNHFVKVRWKKIYHKYEDLTFTRSTLDRVQSNELKDHLETLWNKNSEFVLPIYDISKIVLETNENLKLETLEDKLINLGIKVDEARAVIDTVKNVRRLADWYTEKYNDQKIRLKPSEHEVVAALILPFFTALGWSPQKIGIEVKHPKVEGRMDLVLYSDSLRSVPKIIVEAKAMYIGSLQAINQCIAYANQIDTVDKIIVTDGLRYWLLKKDGADWKKFAYMNFKSLKEKYNCYPEVKGVSDFLEQVIN